jgi:hypothetical protein
MRQKIFLAAAALVAGIAAGWPAGWYFGFSAGRNDILKEWVYNDAKDVQAQLAVLKALRQKNAPQAIELLETRLDDQLVQFNPQEPYSFLTAREKTELRKTVLEAKDHRAAFPRESKRKFVDDMVHSLFARDLYK